MNNVVLCVSYANNQNQDYQHNKIKLELTFFKVLVNKSGKDTI